MKKTFNYRRLLQIVFFALIALISVNHTLVERGINIPFISSASLHALCPYGGVETFVSIITSGVMVRKVHESAVALLAIVLVLSALFGPVFCSYVCPLGSIQEWISKLGRKLFPKRFNKIVPKKLDKWLRYIRYIILIWTVYLSTMSLKLVFEAYDPYYALFNFWTGQAAITSLIVLGLVLVLSLFVERAWCKYACPFGALLGLTNFFRIFKIRRNEQTCTSCNLCSKNCPMNIDVAKKEIVNDHQCIACGECTSENACPVKDTVTHSAKSKKHVSNMIVAICVIVILFAGIGISKLTDNFETTSNKQAAKIKSGEFAGMSDPADIRGSFTFGNISESFDISVEALSQAFNVDTANNSEFQIKNFESMYDNLGTGSVRSFVALYTGLPYDGEVEGMPKSAYDVLFKDGKITQAQYADYTGLASHSNETDVAIEEKLKPENDGEEEHKLISGNTTVKDALVLGISIGEIEDLLETKITDDSMLIKDIAKANGLQFSVIKDKLTVLAE